MAIVQVHAAVCCRLLRVPDQQCSVGRCAQPAAQDECVVGEY